LLLRFFLFHDRSSSVGQDYSAHPCGLVGDASPKLPGMEVKGVPGEAERQSLLRRRDVCAGSLPLYPRISVLGGERW
jgi:hypothetical protein